ncbi:MAG: hypothetical protein JWR10_1162 [Rubritepida sp.]|nr:hypothetical protein [Rubritepida sp.]
MIVTRFALVAAMGALLAAPAWAQSNNPDFTLQNRGQQVINEVYVSSSARNSWGNDRLGQNTLAPGRNLNVVLPAGQCRNDIKVVYADGQSNERRNVNTCELTEVTFP